MMAKKYMSGPFRKNIKRRDFISTARTHTHIQAYSAASKDRREVGSESRDGMALAMNGGSGRNSYSKNSFLQRATYNVLKEEIDGAIKSTLDMKSLLSNSKTFRIADFGCSVGPNTFIAMQDVVESIKRVCQSQCPTIGVPTFQVFFNDQTTNDFNTLFTSLPIERQYFAAGVPGSFHGQLFPECSIQLAYSSTAIHILSRVPEELLDENSPSWNKGRIHFINAPDAVVKAYANRFAKDIGMFLDARAKEVVAKGLVVLILASCPREVPYSQTFTGMVFNFLESSILDMAEEGKISRAQVDYFNVPMYQTSLEELAEIIERNGCFDIERMEYSTKRAQAPLFDSFPSIGQALMMHVRAGLEGMIRQHFGHEIIDELFERYVQKAEEHSNLLKLSSSFRKQLLVVLKRK